MSKQITSDMLDEFREEFQETVKELEKKYELSIKLGKITYSFNSFNAKIECVSCSEGENPEQIQFNKYCRAYGLTEEDFGREFSMNGKLYKISGIATTRRKYPIKAMDLTSRTEYCVTLNSVKKENTVS